MVKVPNLIKNFSLLIIFIILLTNSIYAKGTTHFYFLDEVRVTAGFYKGCYGTITKQVNINTYTIEDLVCLYEYSGTYYKTRVKIPVIVSSNNMVLRHKEIRRVDHIISIDKYTVNN